MKTKSRLAIVDARCHPEIIERLQDFAEIVFPFRSSGITYESISCHPDIFLYQDATHLIVAPNAPKELFLALEESKIEYEKGESGIGSELSNSCFYNCVSTQENFFHREGYSDTSVLKANERKRFVPLPQSYTRCSMLPLSKDSFITSDQGIHKTLQQHGFNSFCFSPEEITIKVHRNGFLGGTCGLLGKQIFFLGNPLLHKDGKDLYEFIENSGFEIITLHDQKLYDGGGVFFL